MHLLYTHNGTVQHVAPSNSILITSYLFIFCWRLLSFPTLTVSYTMSTYHVGVDGVVPSYCFKRHILRKNDGGTGTVQAPQLTVTSTIVGDHLITIFLDMLVAWKIDNC